MPNPTRSPERERLLDAVQQIAPILESCAGEAEEIRHLPQRAVDAMLEADLFRSGAPREVGGLEVDPGTQIELFEAATAAESNAGWNLMIGTIWNVWMGARIPEEGAAAMFNGTAWPITAGLILPFGKAITDGADAYNVSGRWRFASGVHQASWVGSGCRVLDGESPRLLPDGTPMTLIAISPKTEVTVHDTWHTAGLRGTGSHDYSIEDVRVGEGFTFAFSAGPALRGGPWLRLPAPFQAGPGHAGFALGIARRCLDEVKALGDRSRTFSPTKQVERETIQMELGRHMAEYEAVRLYVLDHFAQSVAEADRGETPQGRPVSAYATEMAARCAQFAYKVTGGDAVYETSVPQRYLRDILAAQQHIGASEGGFTRYGKAALEAAASE